MDDRTPGRPVDRNADDAVVDQLPDLAGLNPDSEHCLDWVDAYVRGSLPPTELDRFEDFLLQHPQLLADVEAAQALRSAELADVLPDQSDTARPGVAKPVPGGLGHWLRQPLSMAACLLLVVSLGLNLRPSAESPTGMGIADEIQLGALRGESTMQFTHVPGPRLITVDLGPEIEGQVDVEIAGGVHSVSLQSVPTSLGLVMAVVTDLPPGDYVVNVSRQDKVLVQSSFSVR